MIVKSYEFLTRKDVNLQAEILNTNIYNSEYKYL